MKLKILHLFFFFMLGLLILTFSYGGSLLIFNKLNFIFFILMSSFLGILLSFNKKISSPNESHQLGQYFLYVFCFSIGSLGNYTELINSFNLLFGIVLLVLFGSLVLHLFLCFLFKVPFDVAMVTSTACIYGPPFVGPVAERFGDKKLFIAGITTGLFGYTIGTFLGVTFAYFLKNTF